MGSGLVDFLPLSIVLLSVVVSLLSGVFAWVAVACGMVLYLLSDRGLRLPFKSSTPLSLFV